MRYDAYKLPGVKWVWIGYGKSPEPDHWPEHVSIEGVKIETVRGKGWGMGRAFYKCPECGQARKTLYSGPMGQYPTEGQVQRENASERAVAPARVACAAHWPKSKVASDDAVLAEAKADVLARSYRWQSEARALRERAMEMRLAL